MQKDREKYFMARAIELAKESVNKGGGPFGAVIVKDGEIVAEGANSVTLNNDPTAHAEVCAIRNACATLDTFNLTGCEIYSSCEPCPMCLSAIYWARLDALYYAATRSDAAEINFDDSAIYDQMALADEDRSLPIKRMMRTEALEAFKMWAEKTDKTSY